MVLRQALPGCGFTEPTKGQLCHARSGRYVNVQNEDSALTSPHNQA